MNKKISKNDMKYPLRKNNFDDDMIVIIDNKLGKQLNANSESKKQMLAEKSIKNLFLKFMFEKVE